MKPVRRTESAQGTVKNSLRLLTPKVDQEHDWDDATINLKRPRERGVSAITRTVQREQHTHLVAKTRLGGSIKLSDTVSSGIERSSVSLLCDVVDENDGRSDVLLLTVGSLEGVVAGHDMRWQLGRLTERSVRKEGERGEHCERLKRRAPVESHGGWFGAPDGGHLPCPPHSFSTEVSPMGARSCGELNLRYRVLGFGWRKLVQRDLWIATTFRVSKPTLAVLSPTSPRPPIWKLLQISTSPTRRRSQ